jgi:hypothetical protein
MRYSFQAGGPQASLAKLTLLPDGEWGKAPSADAGEEPTEILERRVCRNEEAEVQAASRARPMSHIAITSSMRCKRCTSRSATASHPDRYERLIRASTWAAPALLSI